MNLIGRPRSFLCLVEDCNFGRVCNSCVALELASNVLSLMNEFFKESFTTLLCLKLYHCEI